MTQMTSDGSIKCANENTYSETTVLYAAPLVLEPMRSKFL